MFKNDVKDDFSKFKNNEMKFLKKHQTKTLSAYYDFPSCFHSRFPLVRLKCRE